VGADDPISSVLAAAEAWAKAHRDLLQRAFERFDETAEWPQLEDLQHDFTVGGRDDIDVAALAHAMPNPLGFVEQGRLILRVRGLSNVESAAGLLDIWAAAIHLACQRWIHDHRTAWLTRRDIEDLTHGDRHQTDLVSMLLLRERWAFGDGRGNPTDDDWKQKVIETARIARSTRDPASLLEKRAAVEFPPTPHTAMPVLPEFSPDPTFPPGPPEPELPGPPSDQENESPSAAREWWRRVLLNPYAVVIIGGVVVLAIWAILSNGFHEVFGGGGSTTRTGTGTTTTHGATGEQRHPGENAQSFKEVAGEGGASTYANPYTLSEPGEPVEPGQTVKVTCRVYAPEPPSVNPDGYWYRLASPPWNGQYYAPANSFWNGDIPGHRPYTHNTDKRVPVCESGVPKKASS
jgi:hypothetical protein